MVIQFNMALAAIMATLLVIYIYCNSNNLDHSGSGIALDNTSFDEDRHFARFTIQNTSSSGERTVTAMLRPDACDDNNNTKIHFHYDKQTIDGKTYQCSDGKNHPETFPNYSVDLAEDNKVKYSIGQDKKVEYGIGCSNGNTPTDIDIYCNSNELSHSDSAKADDIATDKYFGKFTIRNGGTNDRTVTVKLRDEYCASNTNKDIRFNYREDSNGKKCGVGNDESEPNTA